MSDYRDRRLKAMIMPADDAEDWQITTDSIRNLLAAANIDFPERVHGANSRDNGFVMLVDGDGRDRGLRYNPRAHYLSGYPIDHPIVGGVLFCSEDYGDDGMDIQHLTDQAEKWLTGEAPNEVLHTEGYTNWLAENRHTVAHYTIMHPGPIPHEPEH
jgi:hypothetical protein